MNRIISVILPCRNEEQGIGACIRDIRTVLSGREYEIVVSDSSSDKSTLIAKKLGVRIVKHKEGYGNALRMGMDASFGTYLLFADCDRSYDFLELPKFIEKLEEGYDFVIGSRVRGSIKRGAMPFLHRYVGVFLFRNLINTLFCTKFSDTHSGFRGITKEAYEKLKLKTEGMEFASEMVIKAGKKKLKIKEIPIQYTKRKGKKKLRTWRDGWRHLVYILGEVFQ